MSDFFLSYSRKDREWVHGLTDILEEMDRELLVDVKDIFPSEKWRQRLKEMITESHGFVFILTDASVASEECGKEIAVARSLGKRILILNHNLSHRNKVATELAELHWIEASADRDIAEVASDLCEALDTDIERVRYHTRLAVRAAVWEDAPDKVLRGSELTEAEAFIGAEAVDPSPTAFQRDFVRASREAARKRRHRMFAAAAVAVIAVVITGIIAQFQWQASQCNALLGEAEELMAVDPSGARERIIDAAQYCTGSRRALLDALVSRLLVAARPISRIGPVTGGSIVLSEDGQYLAAGPNRASILTGGGSGLEIWGCEARKRIATLSDWPLPPACLTVNAKSLFVADTAGRLVLLDHESGRLLDEISIGPKQKKRNIGGRMVDVSRHSHRPIYVVRIWDTDGSQISFDLHAGMNGPEILDPRLAFRAKADGGTVLLYRGDENTKRLKATSQGGLYAIASIAISPDGDLLVATTEVGIEIWTRDGKRIALFHDPEAKMQTRTVSFDPDGSWLVTTQGTANHASIWDLAEIRRTAIAGDDDDVRVSPRRPWRMLRGDKALMDARFGPDPTIVAIQQRYGHVKIWETGLPAARFDFIPRRSTAALTSPGGWRLSPSGQTWKLASRLDPQEVIELQEANQVSDPSGRFVLHGQSDGGVASLRLKTEAGDIQLLQLTDHLRFIDLLGFSKSGRYFAVGSIRGTERRIMVYRCSACGLDAEASLARLRSEQIRIGD